jgi:hypothetical protein
MNQVPSFIWEETELLRGLRALISVSRMNVKEMNIGVHCVTPMFNK